VSAFAYEIGALVAAQAQALPGHPDGPNALPWYLVLGEPGSGRSGVVRALNLSWPRGDGALAVPAPQALCTYWMPEKAVFIEPGPAVVGPGRQQGLLHQLAYELKRVRPREPVDGVLLCVSGGALADADEVALERHAKALRTYLVELHQALEADVPVYVVLTTVDTLWGFGDVFRWSPERKNEEPWGFALPVGLPSAKVGESVAAELEGLAARIEAMCFDRLAGDEPHDVRARAFQHLAEARELMRRLGELLRIVTASSAFEPAPWLRALAIGSGAPGTGDRLRCGLARFAQMGLEAPARSGTPQPGGLPLHPLLDAVLLPERDLVPTRKRWRDDLGVRIGAGLGLACWLGLGVLFIVRALV
jgi:type VI secretion system protein ImpL